MKREELKAIVEGITDEQLQKILDINKEERHIRGGMATKHKYELLNG